MTIFCCLTIRMIWKSNSSNLSNSTNLPIYMLTLAIESTCDDSSVALVEMTDGDFRVLRMLTYTQGMHNLFGGVVPEYASRKHEERLPLLSQYILTWEKELEDSIKEHVHPEYIYIDYRGAVESITIAAQPWLPGSVAMWVTAAHTLWHIYDIPVREVNHIMWHVFSILCDRHIQILQCPYICLTVSGGHSDIYIVEAKEQRSWWNLWETPNPLSGGSIPAKQWSAARHKRGHTSIWQTIHVGIYSVTKLVQTMDDAVGDAFDKVAKKLWWPYPWGKWIDDISQLWAQRVQKWLSSREDEFQRLCLTKIRKLDVSDQFSFSGIKSQVGTFLKYCARKDIVLDDVYISCIAYVFQDRITDALVSKLQQYIDIYSPSTIWVVGWVSANTMLMSKMAAFEQDIYSPVSLRYCGDNAGMIGILAGLDGID